METCDMIQNNLMMIKYPKTFIKHITNDFKDFLNMSYFDEDFLNIYLCNNILQHFLGQIWIVPIYKLIILGYLGMF